MPDTMKLISQNFHVENGMLVLGGHVSIDTLASEFGTPLFVYDAAILDKQWNMLRSTFPSEFSIYYSVKANPSRAILQHFLAKGCGMEIASGGEFHQAVLAGCPAERIVFAGPGKTEAELEIVIDGKIGEIHAESSLEVNRIETICQRFGVKVNVAIRVNPSGEALGGAMRMGGKPAPFGVDEEQLDDLVSQITATSCLEFRGIHLFAGTQVLDHTILIGQYRKGIEIARRVSRQIKRPLNTLDFGGGLGIPYFEKEEGLDCDQLSQELHSLMAEVHVDSQFLGTQFMVEPGRYLVGESGIYVTRIIDIKVSRGKKFLIVDGGMHHHLAASGNFGQVIKRNFPIAIGNKLAQPDEETVDVVGPLCTPLDVLARNIRLPRVQVGDLVLVLQSGAYARAASPLQFLSHKSPPEVFIQNGTARLIRRRGTFQDFSVDQVET